MSEIIELKKPPFLVVSHLESTCEFVELQSAGDGWALYNHFKGPERIDNDNSLLLHHKALKQIENILNTVKLLSVRINDFANGNFEEYINAAILFGELEEGEEDMWSPFDLLNATLKNNSIDDLPEDINTYSELLQMNLMAQQRAAIMDETVKRVTDKLQSYAVVTDEDGEKITVPFSELPDDLREAITYNKDIKNAFKYINIEHCLDNYNAWYRELKNAIMKEYPFDYMLQFFRA